MMQADRRKYVRKKMARNCSVACRSGRWSCSGTIRDVSDGGVGLDVLKAPRDQDEILLLMLDDAGSTRQLRGHVVWSQDKQLPGVGAMVGVEYS
jgi:hypothetical protein